MHEWDGSAWQMVGSKIEAPAGDGSGDYAAISWGGARIALGASRANSNAGYYEVYAESGGTWTQVAATMAGDAADDQGADGFQGQHNSGLSLSADGAKVACFASHSACTPLPSCTLH